MNTKKIILFTILLMIVISSLSMVSAGLFGFGETEKENVTFNDDSNNALFTATADKGTYQKSSSFSGSVVPSSDSSIEYPRIGYTCSFNGTELSVQYKPLTSYEYALDYYSGNSSYKVTDNKDNFVYDGTDSYGSHVWRVVISDGKQGIIEVTKNEVTDFNDEDFNLIKEFIGTINPNVPDSITIEGITVNTK